MAAKGNRLKGKVALITGASGGQAGDAARLCHQLGRGRGGGVARAAGDGTAPAGGS